MLIPTSFHKTSDGFSPWDQLPAPSPMETRYLTRHFYENTAKYLIKDTVRIMMNGLHIDLEKVMELEEVLNQQLEQVTYDLDNNPLIQTFMDLQYSKNVTAYKEDRRSKLRTAEYYIKPFNYKDMLHRSYFMTLYATQQGIDLPKEELYPGIAKWTANQVKKLAQTRPLLRKFINGELESHHLMDRAILEIGEMKAALYNKSYLAQIENPIVDRPSFNPASPKQKQELFEWLGIPSEATTDTGQPKWDRDQIERVHNETLDENVKHFTQCFIDHSFAAIVRNNFIEAFYNYSVEDRLHGQYKLLGAKSGRYTSSNPNMLNMPSTGSIFSKPVKKCFTAPKGFVIASIDYAALEDRVVANLSKDNNKLGLFLEGLDGHSLSATYYYPERVKALIGNYTDHKQASRDLKKLVDEKVSEAKEVRQDSKPISFGLAYGSYPPKVAATVKIPLEEAEAIFDAYHGELYPGITAFREEYVLPTAEEDGQVHLGLGFTIKSDNPEKDIRTLNNGCSQFWSILTALTINKLHQLIDEAGLQDDILVTSTIYDSIYFEVREDPAIIKWLNDHIIPIMTQDFIEGQIVHNEADLEIGPSWAELYELPHEATEETIQEIMNKFC